MANDFAVFKIGGEELKVPPLNFYFLNKCKESLLALGPDLIWIDYAEHVLRIVASVLSESAPEITLESLMRKCSVPEMRELPTSMSELLEISGFSMGETPAAEVSDGTGTSTPSSPNSQPEASAAETGTGF